MGQCRGRKLHYWHSDSKEVLTIYVKYHLSSSVDLSSCHYIFPCDVQFHFLLKGIQSACSKFQYRVSYIIGHYIYSSSIACRILEMTAAYARRRHLGKNSISRRFCFSFLANSQTKRFKTKSDQPFAYMNV